jgi:hypothetical protein
MTAGLVVAGIIAIAILVAGIWLMERAEAEPAARANGRAPDRGEERAAETGEGPRSGVLADRAG